MSNSKQTAVEWFIINLIKVCGAPPERTWKEAENLLQQAKEMEKEQIVRAFGYEEIDGEQYYNETYGGNK